MERTGLTEVVGQPTRGENKLDRLYVSDPNIYSSIKVVQSSVKSDHRAIVAYTGCRKTALNKTSAVIELRRRTLNQHAMFLQFSIGIVFDVAVNTSTCFKREFDKCYSTALGLLDRFYPIPKVSLTSNDPPYVTADIKCLLPHKNKLMRSGRVEEAGAIAAHIGSAIICHTTAEFKHNDVKVDAQDMWSKI